MKAFEIKEINGYRYAVKGNILLDTVPLGFSDEWLSSAPDADTLILCDPNPFPESVRKFAVERQGCRIAAPYYTAYTLKGILGEDFPVEGVRGEKKIEGLNLTAVSRSGKGSFFRAESEDGDIWSGNCADKVIDPVQYDHPTVAVIYTSGCDYTETMAKKIAEGIRDTEGTDVRLLDIRSGKCEDVIAASVNAAGILIGTSAEDGDAPQAVWNLLTAMNAGLFAGKIAGVFGSATWNTDAVSNITQRLRQLQMKTIDDGFTIQYKPDETAMNSIYEYGYDFGCRIKNVPNTHRSKLVKCLVCGEIFDASLGVCPVCGVGMDKCVPVEDEAINHKEDTDRTYLCAGGGVAALSAAEAIRRRDKTGRIIMISAESTPPINRPMLTKNMVVAARVDGSIDVKEEGWFEENEIELRLNTSVESIDPERKAAILSDGSEILYDRLIYATGAECFIPPFAGWDKDGVFTIRHLSDVRNLWKKIPGAKKAVVIGGGALGLEAASELKKMRFDVTLLEAGARPMPRQLDDITAEAVIKTSAAYGIPLHTGVNIVEIIGEGKVSGVRLDDGTVFPADVVVVSCGVRANLKAAQSAGLECARAVVVNKYMETNVPDIYAAGDCAELDGSNYQLWAEATEQGRVAGANAAGERISFVPVPLGASFEGMNTAMYAIGDVGKGDREYQIVEYKNDIEKSFRRYWFSDEKITGGILFGNTEKIPMLNEAIEKQKTYFELKDQL